MRCASAAVSAATVSFQVVAFEPRRTIPAITAAMAPKNNDGNNGTTSKSAKPSQAKPAAMATFEPSEILRQRAIDSRKASIRSSSSAISSRMPSPVIALRRA